MLGRTHPSEYASFIDENKESMLSESNSFSVYVKNLLAEKGITQQAVFLRADIPERYGYKLLSGEKHTRQRDVILRICYAANFTVAETQHALELCRMNRLYARDPRDALIMTCFNNRPGTVIDVNELLRKNRMEVLRSSGVQG